jgi:hypothetical protein
MCRLPVFIGLIVGTGLEINASLVNDATVYAFLTALVILMVISPRDYKNKDKKQTYELAG